MNWVDWLLIAILLQSMVTGFVAGFARVGVGFVAAVLGMIFGFWSYGIAASHLSDYITSPALANLAGFLLIFGFFVLVGAIVGRILSYFFKWTGLSIVDRLLGLGFGFVRGVLVVTVLVTVLLAFAPTPAPRSVVESRMLPYIIDTSGVLAAITPREIKDAFYGTRDSVKKLWSDHVRGSKLAQQEL